MSNIVSGLYIDQSWLSWLTQGVIYNSLVDQCTLFGNLLNLDHWFNQGTYLNFGNIYNSLPILCLYL